MVREIRSNYFKNEAKDPQDSFKLLQNSDKWSLTFFQNISKTRHKKSPKFIQTISKTKHKWSRHFCELLQTQDTSGPRDSLKLLQR